MPDYDPRQLEKPRSDEAVSFAPSSDLVQAEFADTPPLPPDVPRRRRRAFLPLILFLATCASTFFVGVTGWLPHLYLDAGFFSGEMSPYWMLPMRRAVLAFWQDGLIYMGCVLAILLTHEMGHFVMTVIYRVRATLPYFIPLPISPIGTLGAVIGMDGLSADRRQIFDIGLAGPLAGLIVAIPITWIGAMQIDLENAQAVGERIELPLAMRMAVDHLHPGQYKPEVGVPMSQLNPYFMAGWVGMLVTGLNMMPVSQLDGGHVTYALFGRAAHWIARIFVLAVFIYMGVMLVMFNMFPTWILMALLVLLMGTDHPPTRDDSVRLGWMRTAVGLASLLIPVFCFVPTPIRQ